MIRTLQSCRFVFIMLVVMSHVLGDELFSFGGECGVAFFFIVSGFFVSLSNEKRIESGNFSTKQLLCRQLKKIYPLHILLAVVFFIIGLKIGAEIDILKIIINVLLLQGWTMSENMCYTLNTVSWFLSDIMFCYLMFRLLYARIMSCRWQMILIVAAIILAVYLPLASLVPDEKANGWLYTPSVLRLIDFSIGIICFKVYRSTWFESMTKAFCSMPITKQTFWEVAAVALVVITYTVYIDMPVWLRTCALFWLPIPVVVLFFIMADNGRGMLTRLLQSRLLLWCGGLSMEIYLTHILSIMLLDSMCRHSSIVLGLTERAFYCFPLIVIIAFATQLLFINPVARLLNCKV